MIVMRRKGVNDMLSIVLCVCNEVHKTRVIIILIISMPHNHIASKLNWRYRR